MNAVFTDFKRFAVHDGPGIRTTLFLKGCPLHCLWCHNPESISRAKELGFHKRKCTGCGACVQACPDSCHGLGDNGHRIDRSRCTVCGKCVDACLYDALEIYGTEIAPEEAARRILEDRVFYEFSGGGFTVSGGEPLLQADFCAELFGILKEERIHCCLDTCGNVPWTAFEKVVSGTDLFLYDFKVADPEKHRRFTGAGNELILENLKHLSDCGARIEIRMPLIPEYNLSDTDLQEAAAILSGVRGITLIRLLPYHALAREKFAVIGKPDTMPHVHAPSAGMLKHAAEILSARGLPVSFPE